MQDKSDNKEDTPVDKGERIAKALARAGVGSRREVERLIEAGSVAIHGKPLRTAAHLVTSLDGITVHGEPVVSDQPTKLYRYHKPRGRLTTHKDPEGRRTIFEALPQKLGRLISVGRLDMNTEGLLLLTNDGELARHLELPDNGFARRYRVRAFGQVKENQLEALKDGATIDGIHYGPMEASLERRQGQNSWINIMIREGKNREVRRIMDHLGLTVNRLIRTHYGPFSLGKLETGGIAEVTQAQMRQSLKDFAPSSEEVGEDGEIKKQQPDKWARPKARDKMSPVRRGKLARAEKARRDRNQQEGDKRTSKKPSKGQNRPNSATGGRPNTQAQAKGKPGPKRPYKK